MYTSYVQIETMQRLRKRPSNNNNNKKIHWLARRRSTNEPLHTPHFAIDYQFEITWKKGSLFEIIEILLSLPRDIRWSAWIVRIKFKI